MTPPTPSPVPRPNALRVLRRLLAHAGREMYSAYGTLLCVIGESLIDPGVISVLFALLFFSVDPSQLGSSGAMPAGSGDWIQRLHGLIGTGAGDDRARVRGLLVFTALLLLAWVGKCLFHFGRAYLSQRFAQGLIRRLRQTMYEHLVQQSLAFHRSRETGDLQSRVSNDVTVIQRALAIDLAEAASAPITIIIAVGMMLSLEWRLTLLSLACVPAISFAIAHSGERLRRLAREVQRLLGTLNAFLQERLSGIETVQLFGMEQREAANFQGINDQNYRANLRVATVVSVLTPLVELISAFGMLVLIGFAGYLTIKGPLRLPTLLAFAYIGQRLGSKLGLLGKIWLSAQQAAAAGDRVFEVLDLHEEVPEAPDARSMPRITGRVTFQHVAFRYPRGEEVLRDVNVTIEPGQVVALVGASGAGKTSLVNLIPRFYGPSSGRIEIDGVDIQTVTLHSLRAQIGIVPQEPILFSGPVRDNIAYGLPEATDEQIRAAARAANADGFVTALSQGYDTPVGERAAKLSGGQRQRIAIARTLLRDPRVLILDEATSALDAESEALVQDALERLMEGRTTLVIAHRLSTIQRADRILVLSGGTIVEDGPHAELFQKGSVYRRLYEAQLRTPAEGTPTQ